MFLELTGLGILGKLRFMFEGFVAMCACSSCGADLATTCLPVPVVSTSQEQGLMGVMKQIEPSDS